MTPVTKVAADADRSWKRGIELAPARLARLRERTPPREAA
jgi:hypothetical protein